MKNIHVLPTDKPSRLYITSKGKLILSSFLVIGSKGDIKHIYITSNEEIKRYLDYYLDINTNEVKTSFENIGKYSPNEKKIILTTDQDLIKDGVQAIDDNFMEWFVKNPSCEKVEVIYEPKNYLDTKQGWGYELIIPKEEYEYIGECKGNNGNGCFMDSSGHDCGCFIKIPKEETEHLLSTKANKERLLEDVFNDEKRQGVKELIDTHKQRLEKYSERFDNYESEIGNSETWGKRIKQETLEEAVINFKKTDVYINEIKQEQDKKLYSEEEFRNTLLDINLVNPSHLQMTSNGHGEFPDGYKLTQKGVDYIIEQFKNK
jgi:hypothetical protein